MRADDGTTATANAAYIVAQQAYSLAAYNDSSIHQLATGSDNCYSAYAVSQAYQHANYYNTQIEADTRRFEREMGRINKQLRDY